MADRILEFLKNKYFIGAVVAVFLGLLINSISKHTQKKKLMRKNLKDFKK